MNLLQAADVVWLSAKQQEMLEDLERQKEVLSRRAAALVKENAIAQRKLAACRKLIDMQPDTGRPKRACAQPQLEPEETTRATVRLV